MRIQVKLFDSEQWRLEKEVNEWLGEMGGKIEVIGSTLTTSVSLPGNIKIFLCILYREKEEV